MQLGSRCALLPLLAGVVLATNAGCIITDNTTTTDSASSDPTAAGTSTGEATSGTTAASTPTEGGSSGEPGSTGGSTSAATSGGSSSGGAVAMCGWDAANKYYDCGFDGEDPNGTFPRACPDGLVEGDACGMVPGEGCCDADGNNWYCGDDGMGSTLLVKTLCQ